MENNANPFLNPDWLNLQQQYIDALSSLNPEQAKTGYSHSSQQGWNDALDHWCKAVEKFVPGEGRSLFDNILQQTRLYYSIAGDFAGLLRDVSAADSQTEEWRSILTSHLGRMKAQFDAFETGSKTWSPVSPMFQSAPLDGWKKVISAMSVFPENIFDRTVQDDMEKLQERLTAIPGIGPTREFQDKIVSAIRLWNDYQKKYRDYQSVLSQLGKLALGRLEQKIIELADANKKISSLRQIYNLWIDSNEEVFAQFAFNDDHASLYGELVNSLMHYRQQCNVIMDGILGAMNMPTGEGMKTVYKRQHQMMHALRGSREMQQQMENSVRRLQSELERMSSSVGGTKPAVVSAAGRNKVNKKKKTAHKPT